MRKRIFFLIALFVLHSSPQQHAEAAQLVDALAKLGVSPTALANALSASAEVPPIVTAEGKESALLDQTTIKKAETPPAESPKLAEDDKRPKKYFSTEGTPVATTTLSLGKEDPNDTGNDIVVGRTYKGDIKGRTLVLPETLDSESIYYIKVSGAGNMLIEITSGDNGTQYPDYVRKIVLESYLKPGVVPISNSFLSRKGGMLKILSEAEPGIGASFHYSVALSKSVDISFNSNFKLYTNFSTVIHLVVDNPTLNANVTLSNRLQFILQTSLESQQLYGGEEVEMYINEGGSFPTKTDYQLKASGTLGTGLIKTLSPGSPHYCFKPTCHYYVTLYTIGIDYVNFFPTVFANDSVLKFNQFLFLIEEIEAGEHIQYELSLPKSEDNWVFSVIPTMGSVELFVNPDFRPERPDEYKYLISSHRPEEITITAAEAKEFGFSHEKFFIAYKSYSQEAPAVFRFEVRRYPRGERKYIKENYAEAGVVAKDELVNFYLDIGSDFPQTLTAVFKLESYYGHADLYIKECQPNEPSCQVTKEDVINGLVAESKPRIFRSSKNNIVDQAASSKKDYVTLNFNCSKQTKKYPFDNHYPVSKSCLFAIGVYCRDSFNKYGSYYKLIAHGKGGQTLIKLRNQTIVKAAPGEKLSYRIDVAKTRRSDESFLHVKVVAINGACSVYFSKTNDEPNAIDNEGSLVIQDDNLVALKTQVYEIEINLKNQSPHTSVGQSPEQWVFVGVESVDYCVLDFYVDIIGPYSTGGPEVIRESNVLHRKIDGHQVVDDSHSNNRIYFQNFIFKVPEKDQYNYYVVPKINLSINSQILGLRICVQENKAEFDHTASCTFQSTTEHLTIDDKMTSLDKGKTFLISVQKVVKQNETFSRFPIEFTLSLNQGINIKEQELHMPGKAYSSLLNPSEAVQYKIDFAQMQRRAQIYFYSTDPNTQANVSTGESAAYFHLASLDQTFLGINIQDGQAFKNQHCRDSTTCMVRVSVYSFGAKGTRFTLLYVFDDQPIILKEGDQLIVANNIPTYFAYAADEHSSVSFSTFADHALSVIYSKALPQIGAFGSKDISRELSDNNFDFKTNIENAPRIVYPQTVLQNENFRLLGFFIQPKMHYRSPTAYDTIDLLSHTDALNVYLHTKTQKLLPFILTDGHGSAGEFVYYYVVIDRPEDFSVILTLHSGEATLYLSKGGDDFPTEKRYWKKTTHMKGDEVTVTPDMFSDPKEMIGSFMLGVRAAEETRFSLLFMPEFKNLIKMRFQRLIDMELTYNKNFYFDFFNTQQSYSTLLYAEESDIEVSALNYDDNKYQDFISMVTNEDNYVQKFDFKKGDLPRKKFYEGAVPFGTHVIVRVKAIEKDARINFLIYDASKPVEVPAERRFTFVQNKGELSTFKVSLDARYEEVDFDIKLEFGSVNVFYTDLQGQAEKSAAITSPSQKYFEFRVPKTDKSNDILIFNEFFIKVKSDEFSKFSILVKPKDKFKMLKAFEPEIIYTNPEKDIYVYYHISPQRAKGVHNLLIDFSSVHYFDQRPELLFIAESDVIIDDKSPFLPMPLLDLVARDSGEFKHLEIKPDPQPGYFVLKIEKFPKKLPIKISVSLNHHKNLEMNGLYHGSIPPSQSSSHQYSVFIPKAGEFRLVLESCSGVKVDSAEFFSSAPITADPTNEDHNQYQYNNSSHSTSIKFEDHFVQGFSFLYLNETQLIEKRNFEALSYPVKRGFVDHKGVLRFKVTLDDSRSALASAFHADEFYTLLTEFRPKEKELILKDYVKVFDETEEASHKLFAYHYRSGNNELEVTARLPAFKPQLLVDYPSLRSVHVKVYFYLLADPAVITKLQHCGQSMLKTVPHNVTVYERVIKRDDIAKETRDLVGIIFNSTVLANYRSAMHLNVLSYVSVRFFENEDDEFNINLDFKYTNVPYFLMTIPNRSGAIMSIGTGLGIALLILAVFFVIFYTRNWRGRDEAMPMPYSKAGDGSFTQGTTRLEMSNISRNE